MPVRAMPATATSRGERNAETGLSASVVAKNVIDRPYIVARRPEGIFVGGFRQIIASLRWDYR